MFALAIAILIGAWLATRERARYLADLKRLGPQAAGPESPWVIRPRRK
jgi:hypothetical protein